MNSWQRKSVSMTVAFSQRTFDRSEPPRDSLSIDGWMDFAETSASGHEPQYYDRVERFRSTPKASMSGTWHRRKTRQTTHPHDRAQVEQLIEPAEIVGKVRIRRNFPSARASHVGALALLRP